MLRLKRDGRSAMKVIYKLNNGNDNNSVLHIKAAKNRLI